MIDVPLGQSKLRLRPSHDFYQSVHELSQCSLIFDNIETPVTKRETNTCVNFRHKSVFIEVLALILPSVTLNALQHTVFPARYVGLCLNYYEIYMYMLWFTR